MASGRPTPDSLLRSLTQARSIELTRELSVAISDNSQVHEGLEVGRDREVAAAVLPGYVVRDKLRAACSQASVVGDEG